MVLASVMTTRLTESFGKCPRFDWRGTRDTRSPRHTPESEGHIEPWGSLLRTSSLLLTFEYTRLTSVSYLLAYERRGMSKGSRRRTRGPLQSRVTQSTGGRVGSAVGLEGHETIGGRGVTRTHPNRVQSTPRSTSSSPIPFVTKGEVLGPSLSDISPTVYLFSV